jgi:hypothetical protein
LWPIAPSEGRLPRCERTYPMFRKWFEVRFYPLIQDLVGEEITATEVDEEFTGSMRTALEGLEQRP